jgi:ATP-dependent Clp protease ATP-binding subunit ClpX
VLFIVGGAFSGLDHIVEERLGQKQLGFTFDIVDGERVSDDRDPDDIFSHVMPEDLLRFGLIPEFIGRLPVFTSVAKLDREALVAVLTEPKNALVKQYQRLFELDGVELEFSEEALDEVADRALDRGTGARGLRAILEEVLLNVMYDVPSRDDVEKVIITDEVVRDRVSPTLVPRGGRRERREKSA